jgi:hypothetical protein
MEKKLEDLSARLDEVTRELRQVRERLERLETGAEPVQPPPEPADAAEGPALDETSEPHEVVGAIPTGSVGLVGRTLVVLGGAFLLRAITDAAVVPALGGVAVALAYATWWLVQADRAGAAGHRLGAVFHGLAAAMIAYPLIWETTIRFELLNGPAAAAALVAFFALGLAVAQRRELALIAWTHTLFTIGTGLALLVGTRDFMIFTIALLMLGAAIEAFAFHDRWLPLRWPAAAAADLAVIMAATAAMGPDGPPKGAALLSPAAVTLAGLALPLLYLSSIAANTLLRRRPITPFELTQAIAALVVGFGIATRTAAFVDASTSPIGFASILLGAACYAAAFAYVEKFSGRGTNFYSYSTLAAALILFGCPLALPAVALAPTWAALALAAIAISRRLDPIATRFHGAVYLLASALAAGLISLASDGLLADPGADWRPITLTSVYVTATGVACYAILVSAPNVAASRWLELLPRAATATVVTWSAAGLAAAWLAGLVLTASSGTAAPAFVAAGRTAVLATFAVLLAWAGRRLSLPELTWLVYPLLIGGGIKLVWKDLNYDHPVALFFGFAIYGTSLILTPRLMRREES